MLHSLDAIVMTEEKTAASWLPAAPSTVKMAPKHPWRWQAGSHYQPIGKLLEIR